MPERAARAETLRASSPRAELSRAAACADQLRRIAAARGGAGDPELLDRLPVLRLPREARGGRLLEAGEAVQEVLLAVREGDEDPGRAVVRDDGGPVGRGEARDEVAQALDDGAALLGEEAIVVEVDEELPRDVRLAAVGLQRVEDEVGGGGREVGTVDRPRPRSGRSSRSGPACRRHGRRTRPSPGRSPGGRPSSRRRRGPWRSPRRRRAPRLREAGGEGGSAARPEAPRRSARAKSEKAGAGDHS